MSVEICRQCVRSHPTVAVESLSMTQCHEPLGPGQRRVCPLDTEYPPTQAPAILLQNPITGVQWDFEAMI